MLLGGLLRVESSGRKKAAFLGIVVDMGCRNIAKVVAISVDPNVANGLSLNVGGDGCESKKEEGKDSFEDLIHDKLQGIESDRAIGVFLQQRTLCDRCERV